MKWIILDLEATCWEKRGQGPSEIIEIGALCVDDEKKIIGEFQSFVKPQAHPKLSPFCIDLTSINQEMVETAPCFLEAQHAFTTWIRDFEEDYMLCSWGNYDRNKFIEDCRMHGLDILWIRPHISLKHQYATIKNLRRPRGIQHVLKLEGLEFEGTHHRGIDDARNIAKIFIKYYGKWRPASVLL